jgi:hypothetical protein
LKKEDNTEIVKSTLWRLKEKVEVFKSVIKTTKDSAIKFYQRKPCNFCYEKTREGKQN